jgi:hypothetical protein
MAKKTTKKRFNLVLSEDLLGQVETLAEEEETSVVEMFRRFIKLGLIAAQVQKDPNSALVIREGDHEREILFL